MRTKRKGALPRRLKNDRKIPVPDMTFVKRRKEGIVGIRPEYIRIEEDGSTEATVYSTLPSGMETTVKLDVNGVSLTAVVFGDHDFPVDRKVRFSFHKAAVLFDKESGNSIGVRISWLILERNAVLAMLASSASASASASFSLFVMASRISASMTVKPRPTAWTIWSSRSSDRRTPAMRIIS